MNTVDGESHNGPLPQFKVKSIIADKGYIFIDYEVGGVAQPRERISRREALQRAEGLKTLISSGKHSIYSSDSARMQELAERLIVAAARAAEQSGQAYESQSVKVFMDTVKAGTELNAGLNVR